VNYKRNDNNNWRRVVNRSTPLVGSLAGVIIILSTVIDIAEGVNTVVAVAIGILVLEVSIWYAANPIFTNGRQYVQLRGELDRFIDHVRQLNRVATTAHTEDEINRVSTEMHKSVDTMIELAGSTARTKAAAEASNMPDIEPQEQATT
jgi:hypothetical protein